MCHFEITAISELSGKSKLQFISVFKQPAEGNIYVKVCIHKIDFEFMKFAKCNVFTEYYVFTKNVFTEYDEVLK